NGWHYVDRKDGVILCKMICQVFGLNRSPTSSVKDITPFQAWHGTKPNLSNLRIIGSKVWVQLSKEIRTKLDFNAREMSMVGYDGTNQWRCWDEERQGFSSVSRNGFLNHL